MMDISEISHSGSKMYLQIIALIPVPGFTHFCSQAAQSIC